MQTSTYEEITKDEPEKSLTVGLRKTGGRNNMGRVTARHRGGGNKRLYRIIDFKRNKDGIAAKVIAIEYDPNRSARIALLEYADGEKRYILAPVGLEVGATVMNGPDADILPGNALPLQNIPSARWCITSNSIRARAVSWCVARARRRKSWRKRATTQRLRMPSGEMRLVHLSCRATVGQVGNLDHENEVWGKAGKSRWLGRRPHVRGSAMTPRDHPHGGGEGKAPIGLPHPKTPWGKPALGVKTRRNKRTSRFILKRRK
jgi:large subunit ribosomal protein L2